MSNIYNFSAKIIKKILDKEEIKIEGFHGKQIEGLMNELESASAEYEALYTLAEARFGKYAKVGDITIFSSDIAICERIEKGELVGYFPIVNGRVSSTYSEDKEAAFLIALSIKYEGLNGNFSYYACKLLGKT